MNRNSHFDPICLIFLTMSNMFYVNI